MDRGRIAQLGAPEDVFERPRTAFVAEFVGRGAQLHARAEAGRLHARSVELRAAAMPAAGDVRVFVRPHRVRLGEGPADNVLDGTVATLDYTGEVVQIVVDTPAGRVPVDVPAADGGWRTLRPGAPARVGWSAEDTLCFPAPP